MDCRAEDVQWAGNSIIVTKAMTNEHFRTMRTLNRISDNTFRDIYIRAVFLASIPKRGCFIRAKDRNMTWMPLCI